MKKILLSVVIALASIVTASATTLTATLSCGIEVTITCDDCSTADILEVALAADALFCPKALPSLPVE